MALWTVNSDVEVSCRDRYEYTSNSYIYRCKFSNINSLDDFKKALEKCVHKEKVKTLTFKSSNLPEILGSSFNEFTSLLELDASGLGLKNVSKISINSKLPDYDGDDDADDHSPSSPDSKIDLSNNSLTTIDELTFFGLKKLSTLNLGFNQIESIHDTAFYQLELYELLLNNNNLKNIHFIDSFFQVKELDLSYNNIGNLGGNLFSRRNSLKKLNLSSTGINQTTYGLFSPLLVLENLDLSKNHLPIFYIHHFYGMENVRRLDMSNNHISTIQHVTRFKHVFPQLERLILSGNEIPCLSLIEYFFAIESKETKIIAGHKQEDYVRPNIKGVNCLN